MEIKIICRRGFGSQTTENVKVLKRTCWAIVLLIRSFVFPCPRCRRRRGLFKVPIVAQI